MPDERIPGTLNVGHTLPTIAQAFIFIAIVEVEMTTLVGMIAASVAGAWLGAGVVAAWPRRTVQIGMGLRAARRGVVLRDDEPRPLPGRRRHARPDARRCCGSGIAGNFVLGALMTLGIGLYAPCMILVALLGMNPRAAFPIMMGSCAFLMPIGEPALHRARAATASQAAMGLALGGIPAVFIAAFLVKSLPLDARCAGWSSRSSSTPRSRCCRSAQGARRRRRGRSLTRD